MTSENIIIGLLLFSGALLSFLVLITVLAWMRDIQEED